MENFPKDAAKNYQWNKLKSRDRSESPDIGCGNYRLPTLLVPSLSFGSSSLASKDSQGGLSPLPSESSQCASFPLSKLEQNERLSPTPRLFQIAEEVTTAADWPEGDHLKKSTRDQHACNNCRDLDAKCDEQLPRCRNCWAADVNCVYGSTTPENNPKPHNLPRRPRLEGRQRYIKHSAITGSSESGEKAIWEDPERPTTARAFGSGLTPHLLAFTEQSREGALNNLSSDIKSVNDNNRDLSNDESSDKTGVSVSEESVQENEYARFISQLFKDLFNGYIARLHLLYSSDSFREHGKYIREEENSHSAAKDGPASRKPRQASSKNSGNSRQGTNKRSRKEEGDPSDDDDPDLTHPKRPRSQAEQSSTPLLACIFYKNDPSKYCKGGNMRYKSCPSGYRDLHRLKEHFKRVHTHCPRCKKKFNTEADPENHGDRDETECQCNPKEQICGITEEHKKQFTMQTKGARSEAEKWKIVYKIVFPGENVPFPYSGVDDVLAKVFDQVTAFLDRYETVNLPQVIARILEAEIEAGTPWVHAIADDLFTEINAQLCNYRPKSPPGASDSSNRAETFAYRPDASGYNQYVNDLVPPSSGSSTEEATTVSGSPYTPLQDFGTCNTGTENLRDLCLTKSAFSHGDTECCDNYNIAACTPMFNLDSAFSLSSNRTDYINNFIPPNGQELGNYFHPPAVDSGQMSFRPDFENMPYDSRAMDIGTHLKNYCHEYLFSFHHEYQSLGRQ